MHQFVLLFLLSHLFSPLVSYGQQVTADPAVGAGRFTQNSTTPLSSPYPRNTAYTVLVNVRNAAGSSAIPANGFSVVVQLGKGVKFTGTLGALSANYSWSVDSLFDPSQVILRGVLQQAVPAGYNEDLALSVRTVDGCISNNLLLSGININSAVIVDGNEFLNDDAAFQYTVLTPATAGCIGGTVKYGAGLSGLSYQWQKDTGGGYVDIVNDSEYSGVNTDTLTIRNAAGPFSGFRFRCQVQTTLGTVFSGQQTLRFENRWNGLRDADWHNAANWSCCQVPDQYTDVIITGFKNRYPQVSVDARVKSLTGSTGASVKVNTGAKLSVEGGNN